MRDPPRSATTGRPRSRRSRQALDRDDSPPQVVLRRRRPGIRPQTARARSTRRPSRACRCSYRPGGRIRPEAAMLEEFLRQAGRTRGRREVLSLRLGEHRIPTPPHGRRPRRSRPGRDRRRAPREFLGHGQHPGGEATVTSMPWSRGPLGLPEAVVAMEPTDDEHAPPPRRTSCRCAAHDVDVRDPRRRDLETSGPRVANDGGAVVDRRRRAAPRGRVGFARGAASRSPGMMGSTAMSHFTVVRRAVLAGDAERSSTKVTRWRLQGHVHEHLVELPG